MLPGKASVVEAADRIAPYIHRTPVLTCSTINRMFGGEIFFKCENFQKAGAFKSRGATNAVFQLSDTEIQRGVATHSSGNHAGALALAASRRGIKANIVMPENSSRIKILAVESYGGLITRCKPTLAAREETLKEVISKTGAVEIHPYNDLRIIAGQATAAKEMIEEVNDLDLIMAPVGGGGLLSGTALSARYFGKHIRVIAAEPAGADDAFRSFTSGTFIPSVDPRTIADGLRTSLGSLTFPIIMENVDDIVTVSEEGIIEAMRLIWERMKIIVEPSSAVPLAAIIENKLNISGKRTGIILSGGNVDLENLPFKTTV
ncbi:threonine dehydratase [Lentimicrobium saccharophilum]|uniref:Threonine dehydratase n=1 Tax=Lentimicrobium saccharophilum TaxID=1678841 RepID=A0A0S7BVJ7_9BACT|nr:pyridoxal-phosphate dependent enzyme [Lentimicrobium saccharophilum]GAP44589.1 threonine dehydratase [Lentimicrobium saccharophilum]